MSNEDYQMFSKLLIKALLDEERKETDPLEYKGMPQSRLCEHVITGLVGQLDSMQDLMDMSKKLNAVIERLIKVDKALMVVEDAETKDKRTLRVHPNSIETP